MTNDLIETADPIENLPAEPAVSTEVADPKTPEADDAPQKPELTPAEREARALKRRVDRLTREKYQLQAQVGQTQQRPPVADDTTQPAATDVRQEAREYVEAERFNAKCNDIAASGTKGFPDFMEKFAELGAEVPLFDAKQRPLPVMEALLDADNPAALIHHLGSNPDLAAELADLTPRQQVRKLALIERDMDSKPPPPKPSNAPKPLQPVRGTAADSWPDPSKDPEGWIAKRNAQVRRK
jgi:hypothetical protein